jgi:hypothetical protein
MAGDRPAEAGGASLTREVLALAAVGVCSIVVWHSLICLVTVAHAYPQSGTSLGDLLLLLRLAVAGSAAVYVVRETGLLTLARRRAAAHTRGSDWWCWFAHFKLSLAVLSVTCVAAWFARNELLLWLVLGPDPAGSPPGDPWYWVSPAERARTETIIVVSSAWIAALPLVANDIWRLLWPSSNLAGARLRVPFAVVTGLVTLGCLALVRQYAPSFFRLLLDFCSWR